MFLSRKKDRGFSAAGRRKEGRELSSQLERERERERERTSERASAVALEKEEKGLPPHSFSAGLAARTHECSAARKDTRRVA